MAEHVTTMYPAIAVAGYDLYMGRCSCGKEYGPGKASEVNAALVRHVQKEA